MTQALKCRLRIGVIALAITFMACTTTNAMATPLRQPESIPSEHSTVHVWCDMDGDGAQDADEPNEVGFYVTLASNSGGVLGSIVEQTDAAGNIDFGDLPAGQYIVSYEIAGGMVSWTFTFPVTIRIGTEPEHVWLPVIGA